MLRELVCEPRPAKASKIYRASSISVNIKTVGFRRSQRSNQRKKCPTNQRKKCPKSSNLKKKTKLLKTNLKSEKPEIERSVHLTYKSLSHYCPLFPIAHSFLLEKMSLCSPPLSNVTKLVSKGLEGEGLRVGLDQ